MPNYRRYLFSVFLAGLFMILAAAPAGAGILNFGDYTVDVPGRWTIERDRDLVMLISPGREAVFFITTGLSQKPHKARIAGELAKYTHITRANPRQNVTLVRLRERRVVVTIIGDHPDRTSIYHSIKETEQPRAVNPFVKPKSK